MADCTDRVDIDAVSATGAGRAPGSPRGEGRTAARHRCAVPET